jgi:hypothetical protein
MEQMIKRGPGRPRKPVAQEDDALDQGAPIHESRDREYPSDEILHEDTEGDWTPPSLLKAPPPREGFVQRWAHVERRNGAPNVANVSRRSAEGWTPRHPSTLPHGFLAPTANHGTFGNVIMVEGMILMEMSTRRNAQRMAYYQNKLGRQTEAMDKQLLAVQTPGNPIHREARTVVEKGRRPKVQSDDE